MYFEYNKLINNENKIYFIGSSVGIIEHYSGQIPRALLDFKQLNNNLTYQHIFKEIYNKKGLLSFYPSNFIQMSSISCAHIWLFYFYELNKKEDNFYTNIFYGGISRIGHDLFMLPGDYIRMKCNISGDSTGIVIKKVLSNSDNTIKNLKIISPLNILINIPGNISDFFIIKYLSNKYGNESHKIYGYGLIAGIFSTIITNPIDIVRTNLIVQNTNNFITKEQYKFTNINNIIRNVYGKHGSKGFYNGITMRSLQTSLCFGTYELFNKYFE